MMGWITSFQRDGTRGLGRGHCLTQNSKMSRYHDEGNRSLIFQRNGRHKSVIGRRQEGQFIMEMTIFQMNKRRGYPCLFKDNMSSDFYNDGSGSRLHSFIVW